MERGEGGGASRKGKDKRETQEVRLVPVNGHPTRTGSKAYASFCFSFKPFHGSFVVLQKRTEQF